MKRAALSLVVAALVVLSGCASDPETELNGSLSSKSKDVPEQVARKNKNRTTTTRRRRPPTTRTIPNTTPPTRPAPTIPQPTLPPDASQTGVAGVVLIETCPPPSSERPCSERPGVAQVDLLRADGKVAGSYDTTDNGSFVIGAAPGTYTLVAKPPKGTRKNCDAISVTVPADNFVSATIHCVPGR